MPAIVWKGFISFGLVSFPVRLYSAARAEAIHFHLLHRKDLSRVREVWYCAKEDKPIERSELVKGYETSKGEYVVVEEEELKHIAPATASTMDVLQFVRNDEVDPIWFERSYYVAPDEKIAKPFRLFLETLRETGRSAIVKLAMHMRENVAIIRPGEDGLLLHTLYYPDELHAGKRPEPVKASFSKQELALAKQLVEQLSGPFKPKGFHDEYRKNVEELVERKRNGQKVQAIDQPKNTKVVDLMEALKKSIDRSASDKGTGAQKASAPEKKVGRRAKIA